MQLTDDDLILVTGATGLVGSHIAEQARQRGLHVRAMCRPAADTTLLRDFDVEVVEGDLSDAASLQAACVGVKVIVHCAAKVGDWGPTGEYRRVNVEGTRTLLNAALQTGSLERWVQISSLGVYSGGDHYGTDETTAPNADGIDGYTLTKVESEKLVCDYVVQRQLPAVVLRPGFIYGPRDRTVMPRLMGKLRDRKFAYLGNHDKLMNNTFVGNLCEAVWLAIRNDNVVGEVFNIRDPRAVTKKEFMDTICETAGYSIPTKVVPLHIARFLSWHMETLAKLLGRKQAPLVNSARIKFLGRNLDFCIEKANLELGYQPSSDFRDAMRETVKYCVNASTHG
ncbi:MAG: NAD-dependent epimerase/dehydratase family protein [Fuerstiella sp.]|nr:NAD-dependent epimerase/dehydratase family protein [Fuerstiella sp.]MCP4511512.1 NAD-dependent epimerase/dehydratase family protein [Fuerstiella sp.]